MWLAVEWDETPLIPLTVVVVSLSQPLSLNLELCAFLLLSSFFLRIFSYLFLALILHVAVFVRQPDCMTSYLLFHPSIDSTA